MRRPSDHGDHDRPRFLAVARKRLSHLFPILPDRAGFYKRREALSDTIEALIALEGIEASLMAMPYRPGYGSRPVVLAGSEELQATSTLRSRRSLRIVWRPTR